MKKHTYNICKLPWDEEKLPETSKWPQKSEEAATVADTPVSRSFSESRAGLDTEPAPHPETGQGRGRASLALAGGQVKFMLEISLPRREQGKNRKNFNFCQGSELCISK